MGDWLLIDMKFEYVISIYIKHCVKWYSHSECWVEFKQVTTTVTYYTSKYLHISNDALYVIKDCKGLERAIGMQNLDLSLGQYAPI